MYLNILHVANKASTTAAGCHVRNAILICVRPVALAVKERNMTEE